MIFIPMFLSVLGLFGIWFVLFSPVLPKALTKTVMRTNLPFYLDFIHTRTRRKSTRIVKASRRRRRAAAWAIAKHSLGMHSAGT